MKNNSKINNGSETTSKRRNFIKTSAAAGAAALVTRSSSANAKTAVGKGRKIRVGALGVGSFSFFAYTWGDLLSPHGTTVNRGSLETDVLNMEITHVWDVNPGDAQAFAEKVGA